MLHHQTSSFSDNLNNIIKKSTKSVVNNNALRFPLTVILEPERSITVSPILPIEKESMTYHFQPAGYSEIYFDGTDNEITVGSFPFTAAHCYGHWILNIFPRIYMCYHAGARNFICSSTNTSKKYMVDTLSYFNDKPNFYTQKDFFKKYPNNKIKLIYPYIPDESDGTNKKMKDFHIHKFTHYAKQIYPKHFNIKKDPNPRRKIRIIRENYKDGREISNSPQVNKFLETRGFELIDLAQLPIRDQLQILSEAKVVFSVHGSGFVNTACMSPNSLIIELGPKSWYTPDATHTTMRLMAEVLGTKYEFILMNNDLSVEIDKIEPILRKYNL